MSGGYTCKCSEVQKPLEDRQWRVTQYRSNRSAFNGYHTTGSKYSALKCLNCHSVWRTKCDYADRVKHATEQEKFK